MKMRVLGRTGIQVSPYCLGTMMFGLVGNPDQDDCVRIVHRALDAGINFVDTADVYGPGSESERILGKALKGRRDDVVLATKVIGSMGEDPNRAGSPRRWIVAKVENSPRVIELVLAALGLGLAGLDRLRPRLPPRDRRKPRLDVWDVWADQR